MLAVAVGAFLYFLVIKPAFDRTIQNGIEKSPRTAASNDVTPVDTPLAERRPDVVQYQQTARDRRQEVRQLMVQAFF